MNLRSFIVEKAQMNLDHPCIFFEDQIISYKQFNLAVNRASNAFHAMGIRKGNKVALIMPNCPEYLYVWFGLAKIGAVTVCVSTRSRGEDLLYLIKSCDSQVAIVDVSLQRPYEDIESGLDNLSKVVWYPMIPSDRYSSKDLGLRDIFKESSEDEPPMVEVLGCDPLLLSHTGGTTGLPKYCVLSHTHFIEHGKYTADLLCINRTDRVFNPLPLFHVNPQRNFVLPTLAGNGSILIVDRFSASNFWSQVRNYKITVLILHVGPVEILKRLPPNEDDRNHSVRLAFWGSDWEFMERFNIPLAVSTYGTSEAGSAIASKLFRLPLSPELKRFPNLRGICGKARDDIEIRIVNNEDEEMPPGSTGEIVVRSSKPFMLFSGYYKMADKTVQIMQNGWFHTGDVGYIDVEGNLHFHHRKEESIRVKGEWVHIHMLEAVIASYLDVQACAVVGVAEGVGGDEVKAYIQLKPGRLPKPEDIIAHCEGKIAYYMIPRYLEFVDELPITGSTGTVQKNLLKQKGVGDAWDREKAGYKLKRL